ncbi:MAG: hypothetical protein JWQ96_3471 [Segetibacter sp.]|nr:hypothetical protein [Segetibacter sp.]
MLQVKIVSGNNVDEIWQKIALDLSSDPFEYGALIEDRSKRILLTIDIDPGGGFESGYASTSFSAAIEKNSGFKFAIHREGFLDEVGKFFGMQDVVIGYEEFDKKVIVKTNDAERVKTVFADEQARKVLATIPDFTLAITGKADKWGEG